MGLTKQYLRYRAAGTFNVIGSGRGGAVYCAGPNGDVAAVAAVQSVILWDVRRKEKVGVLLGDKHEVTALVANGSGSLVAVGYADGCIRLFDVATTECEVTFTGHKTAVTSLAFDQDGGRLVSGARDTHIIVWDVVAEAGLFRLHGHKGPVTAVKFLKTRDVVVSASKDTFVKFWDLSTQHCFKTLTGHLTEVWDFVLLENDRFIVTGCSDAELRVWSLEFKEEVLVKKGEGSDEPAEKKEKLESDDKDGVLDENDDESSLEIRKLGSILRSGTDKLQGLTCDPTGRLVACHGNSNQVELFLVCNEEEIKKRIAKKAKKERKRTGEEVNADELKPTLQEQFRRLKVFKIQGKSKSVNIRINKKSEVKLLVLLGNNQVEQLSLSLSDKEGEVLPNGSVDLPGHRSDARTVAFSSDNTAVVSASSESVKVWNRSSQVCVRTMACGYGLCSTFVPGDRHVVLGTKKGTLQVFDLGSGEMTEEVEAHSGEVWSLALTHDKRGLVTGSADKTVKFWNFELMSTGSEGTKQLSLLHVRTLQLEEGVVGVSCSGDGRLIAVSLLDSTVKVFFVDTLKFFLSLYGHKLPVLAMDISSDSTLIATASADRNMKIWGLDFGDCHKSIFAHDDSITGLRFMPDTHMLVTCGKDGKVKMWDADNFQRIITLNGHCGEVWALAVSPNGKFVVTSGKDRSLRLWEKTQEVVVLDDERETEREEEAEAETQEAAPVERGGEASMPGRRTAATERASERLMEALQMYKEYTEQEEGGEKPELPPLMMAFGAESALDYVSKTIGGIKPSEMEETLLVLPLDNVTELVAVLAKLLEGENQVETNAKCLLFLLEIHHGPIVSNKMLEGVLTKVGVSVCKEVGRLRDITGTNLAGLRHLANVATERKDVQLFVDATMRVREKNKKKKKKEKVLQRAIMAV